MLPGYLAEQSFPVAGIALIAFLQVVQDQIQIA